VDRCARARSETGEEIRFVSVCLLCLGRREKGLFFILLGVDMATTMATLEEDRNRKKEESMEKEKDGRGQKKEAEAVRGRV